MPRPHDSPRGESLPRSERLRKRADYQRCYRKGRRRHGAHSVLYSAPNELAFPRLGITASKKVGGAVVRFRLKRRVREIYRRWSQRSSLPRFDLVVHLKPSAARASFDQLRLDLTRQLVRLVRQEGPVS